MARIERPEDDIYMLYTGGTTGMPKGVMYTVGGITQGFITLGYPLLALEPPTEVAAVGASSRRARGGQHPRLIPGCPLMHGTGMWLGCMIPLLAGGRVVHAREPLASTRTSCWHGRATSAATTHRIVGDAFAKPLNRAIDEARAARRRTTSRA